MKKLKYFIILISSSIIASATSSLESEVKLNKSLKFSNEEQCNARIETLIKNVELDSAKLINVPVISLSPKHQRRIITSDYIPEGRVINNH